ncbi:MAG: FAD-dependent oxidoreductase [Pirellulales bacterium]
MFYRCRFPVIASIVWLLMNFLMTSLESRMLNAQDTEVDLLIVGGTSGGITAAIAGKEAGLRVLLIEPSAHLGGLSSAGLGATDIGNKVAIGGLSREFYKRIKLFYDRPESWTFEKKTDYRSPRQKPGEDTLWTFEPRVAEAVFREWLDEKKVPYRLRCPIDRSPSSVVREGKRLKSLRTAAGEVLSARYFIDATYEGDLLPLASVDFIIGREANAAYNETLNGVQTRQATKHQFFPGVDPYVRRGDKSSGLLPGVQPEGPGDEGSGDHRLQAYCLRMYLTDVEPNRIPFAEPQGYDERDYELLLRNFEAGLNNLPWHSIMMPNRKTDTNNNTGFSTDFIGANTDWPEASYAEREAIYRRHVHYQAGLCWTLAHHPRVPEKIRREAQQWGLAADEFRDSQNWPHALYVREGRRLVGRTVMTEHHCRGKQTAAHSVGMAAYTMDSHNVQRYVDANGQVRNEGDVQVAGFPPYPIDIGALIPKEEQCENLAVPVCLSASHIAYGSIRMEPVFMVLGQSAALMAAEADKDNRSLQSIDYTELRTKLLAADQVLSLPVQ